MCRKHCDGTCAKREKSIGKPSKNSEILGGRFMEKKFLEFVAEVMNTDVSDVSMDMEYKTGLWDSIMMMTLIMEIEAEYGINIPIEDIGNYKTLRDLYNLTVS
jgi:acyl carrier protein